MHKYFKKIALFIFTFLIISCHQNKNRFEIKGHFENSQENLIFLQELTSNNDGITDTFKMNSSGKFLIKKDITYPKFYKLRIDNQDRQIILVVSPGETIKLNADAKNIFDTYNIVGSENSKLAQQLSIELSKTIKQIDSLNSVYISSQNNPNFEELKAKLLGSYGEITNNYREFSLSIVKKNPKSIVSIFALYQQFNKDNWVFNKEEDLQYFILVDSLIFESLSSVPYVKTFHENVAQMKAQQLQLQNQDRLTAIGATAPEIALPSQWGDTIRLSSFKGKYVLLDFWASWCNPCRNENPYLVNAYRNFKYKGFEILQVSLDKSKEAWMYAIRKDRLKWKHASDLKFWDSPIAKLYNIESIPSNFLIDKEGVIIDKNLRGEQLEQKLKEIFDNTNNTTGQ